MRETRDAYKVLVGKPEGRKPLGRPMRIYGRMILKRIFERWNEGHGLDRSGSGLEQVAGFCNCANVHSGSIKYGEFLE